MKIVFSIPGFDPKSNGLNVFHLLAREFSNLGAKVRIIPWPANGGFKYEEPAEYKDLYSARFDLSDAVAFLPDAIPPELVMDLRSKVKSCVWWLCNIPGLLGHDISKFENGDFLFAYSKLISQDLPQLYYHSDITGIPSLKEIKRKRKDADLVVVYTGKGKIHEVPNSISELIKDSALQVTYISRFFPETKEVLYSILSRAKFVISFDPISNLNYEANLFGAPVFLVNQLRPDLNLQKDFNIPFHGFFTNANDFNDIVKIGLDLDIIHSTHAKALAGNKERVKKAYDFFKGWLDNSDSSFLHEFQSNISGLYNKVLKYEIHELREVMDINNGSKRNLTEREKKFISECVENTAFFKKNDPKAKIKQVILKMKIFRKIGFIRKWCKSS